VWSRKSPTFPFIDINLGFRALKFNFWLAELKTKTPRDAAPIKHVDLDTPVMKVSSDSFMLAHNLFATAGIGSKSSTKDINEDTSLSQLIGYELYYEAVGATDADIAAVSDDDDDDYTATKAHMVLYPGVGIPTSDTGGRVAR
jgi:hypothetical protein